MTTSTPVNPWRPTRILAATDLSPISANATDYAAAFARHFNAELFLAHVLTEEESANQAKRQDAERGISEILQSENLRGVRRSVLLERGFLWQTLESLIRGHKIELVVVGTHGRRHSSEEFQGSWAELIFRHAECPVLTVGPACRPCFPAEMKFANILLASDFGRPSEHATPYACSLARDYGARLLALNVVQDTANYSESEWTLERETARIRLVESVPPDMNQHCRMEYVVERGDSANQILNVARSKDVDLIVMGAKIGRKLVTHLPEPTVYTVAAQASCPVLTVAAY